MELHGNPPPTAFTGLMSVAASLLRAGFADDEIVAGMLATRTMNAVAVSKVILEQRRRAADQPATGPVAPLAARLISAARKHPRVNAAARGDNVADSAQALTTMLTTWNENPVDVAIAFAAWLRTTHGAWPGLDDLKHVPWQQNYSARPVIDPVAAFDGALNREVWR